MRTTRRFPIPRICMAQWRLFITFLLFNTLPGIFSARTTSFIDDTDSRLTYSPAASWIAGSGANHGRVAPDSSKAHDGTWHDTTQDSELDKEQAFVDIPFEGTGIDLYCILANNLDEFTGVKADYSFNVDGVRQSQTFLHNRDSGADQYYYNRRVFSVQGLANGKHTVRIIPNGGPGVAGSSLLLFDYAEVIVDVPDPTPTDPTTSKSSSSTTTTSSTATPTSSSTSGASSPSTNLPTSGSSTTLSSSSSSTGGTLVPASTSGSPETGQQNAKSGPSIGAIVGAAVGGALALIALFVFLLWRRRRRRPIQLTPGHEGIPLNPPLSTEFASIYPAGPSQSTLWLSTPSDPSTRKLPSPPPGAMNVMGPGPAPSSSGRISSSAETSSGRPSGSSRDPNRAAFMQNLMNEVAVLREQIRIQQHEERDPPPRYEDAT